MKKRIFNYEQQKLLDFNLDIDELIIIDYIAHFKNTGKMEEHIKNNKVWNWISWKKISEDLPILKLKKEAIQKKCLYNLGVKPNDWKKRLEQMTENTRKRVKSYKFLGLIEFDTIGTIGSEKTIFRFTDKWYKLIEEKGETEHKKADTTQQVPTFNKINYKNNTNIINQNSKTIQYKYKNKTKFHNCNESFSKYNENELEKILLESQKGKFK